MEYRGSDGLVGLAILGRPRPSRDARPYLDAKQIGQHVVLSLPHYAETEDELLRVGFAGAQDAAGVAEAMEGELVG